MHLRRRALQRISGNDLALEDVEKAYRQALHAVGFRITSQVSESSWVDVGELNLGSHRKAG